MLLKDLEPAERPRERLLRDGPDALSDAELMAILFGTGRGSGEDALALAHRMLETIGGLGALARVETEGLPSVRGVGAVKDARVRAALALSRRVAAAVENARAKSASGAYASDLAQVYRACVSVGESALLAHQPGTATVTLALGERLGPSTRPGALLARLLALPSERPWTIVSVRPGGEASRRERDAARRVLQAAETVGLEGLRIVVVGRDGEEITRERAS